jgi:hypothetical protein
MQNSGNSPLTAKIFSHNLWASKWIYLPLMTYLFKNMKQWIRITATTLKIEVQWAKSVFQNVSCLWHQITSNPHMTGDMTIKLYPAAGMRRQCKDRQKYACGIFQQCQCLASVNIIYLYTIFKAKCTLKNVRNCNREPVTYKGNDKNVTKHSLYTDYKCLILHNSAALLRL